jgi:hypothetical protein
VRDLRRPFFRAENYSETEEHLQAPCLTPAMIEVDDSELEEDDREFLIRWAEALNVTLGVLLLRILEAAIDGDRYVKMRPRDDARS